MINTEQLFSKICTVKGTGISEGFYLNGDVYQDEKDLIKSLYNHINTFNIDINLGCVKPYEKEDALGDGLIPKTISKENLKRFAYDNDYYYFTNWYGEDLEEEGTAYSMDGTEYSYINNTWIKQN